MSVRVQIYTAQTDDEAMNLARLGVDHVGLTPSNAGLPGEIDLDTARSIRDRLVGVATSVALSVEANLDSIVSMVESVRPDIIHLCGPPGALTPNQVAELRSGIGATQIMMAVAVTDVSAIDVARAFAPRVDYLILDSVAPDIPGIGAAGVTHDWALSAEIVSATHVPVILAGGLTVENVAAAISQVAPWGVDSLTHTNRPDSSGGFTKDLALVEAFVAAARGAESG